MKNIYYMIWADALHQAKIKKPNIDNGSLIRENLLLLSSFTSFKLAIIVEWIYYYYNNAIYKFELGIVMPGYLIDRIISFSILIYIPSITINYTLIFINNKYQRIMKKYPSQNGRYALGYIFISLGFFIVSAIVLGIFIRVGITLK